MVCTILMSLFHRPHSPSPLHFVQIVTLHAVIVVQNTKMFTTRTMKNKTVLLGNQLKGNIIQVEFSIN